jgi:N-methylhydantoinase A
MTARLAIDIGGTFTDLALEHDGRVVSGKVLTTPRAPEEAVMRGVALILERAGVAPGDLATVIHGTTLATNAIIERKGARTALVVTEGFRDSLEIAHENRFEQYDIFMDKPPPLVPRNLRLPVPERIEARGRVVTPLDEAALAGVAATLVREEVTSVAIGFLHSYVNPAHEERARAVLAKLLPDVWITLSSEVCPEMREYERWCTACANAYVQPLMDRYLARLAEALRARGIACPLFLITSAGGLTTVETARRFPIRLVESGPAGGAILAARIAGQCDLDRIVSFDMGGTTAKICLIDGGRPEISRSLEVARQYRFLKGSGLPVRVPVIEMVEIGAGGGSVAVVDAMARIRVGPESAGSEPGPACYGRGGTHATVTDADVVLGRIRPDGFAGGTLALDPTAAITAVAAAVGKPLGLDAVAAALGMSDVVEENMANAARVHAVERGKDLGDRAMIAFGGAAPLHAARLATKLGIGRVMVPTGAGVGSAIGFLMAPVAFEVVRSRPARLDAGFDPTALNALRAAMRQEAEAVIRRGAADAALAEAWTADMRYRGQGHDVTVAIPAGAFSPASRGELIRLFEAQYATQFGRNIPGLEVEVLSWALRLAAVAPAVPPCPPAPPPRDAKPHARGRVADPASGERVDVPVYRRTDLAPGDALTGPALIVEDETTTLVTAEFTARINGLGYIVLTREQS